MVKEQTVKVYNRGASLIWAMRLWTQLFPAKHCVVYRSQDGFVLDKV